MTVEKTLLYFKLRFEGREMKFEHEFRNLPFNDEAGLTAVQSFQTAGYRGFERDNSSWHADDTDQFI
jgi:hypothetical protein